MKDLKEENKKLRDDLNKLRDVIDKIRIRANKMHAFCGAYDRTAEDIRNILKELK